MLEEHFPEFYRKADEHAASWQRRYLMSEGVQLASLLIAALISAFGDLSPLLVVIVLLIATGSHIYRLVTKAGERWWNGRAGAESAKTLCWKYVVGGEPFRIDNMSADGDLSGRLSEVASEVASLLPVSVSQGHVSAEMRAQRSQTLENRVAVYLHQRIRCQLEWYSAKSEFNSDLCRRWSLATIVGQVAALVLGIVAAIYGWRFDFVGFVSAAAASGVAWIAVKQFDVLARSYAVASHELSAIDMRITGRAWSEHDWATFVNEAEEAISREHTSWRASRAV